jgi:acetyl esterase/lipase
VLHSRIRYGPQAGQVGNWWRPAGAGHEALPTVVLIHGGSWKWLHTKANVRLLGGRLVRAGYAVWNIEYRRVGRFGTGGWPATLLDVSAAVDHVLTLDGADPDRVVTVGHSAGGQLALWAAARHRVDPAVLPLTPLVRVRGAVSLAGALNLERLGERADGGPVRDFLGGAPDTVPERYAAASPYAMLPLGVPHAVLHGLADRLLSPLGGERYALRAAELGDDVRFVPLPRVTHNGIVSPRGPGATALLRELGRLMWADRGPADPERLPAAGRAPSTGRPDGRP